MREMTFEEFADKWGPRLGTKEALWMADYVLQGIWVRLLWFLENACKEGEHVEREVERSGNL